MLRDIVKKVLIEATSEIGSRGSYNPPFRPGFRKWIKNSLDPFNEKVSDFVSAVNNYDSLDGKMSKNNKNIKKKEKISKQIRNKDWNIEVSEEGDDEFAKNFKVVKQKVNLKKNNKDINEWIEVTDDLLNEDLAVWFGTKKKPKGSNQPKGPWVNICRKKEGGGHPPCGRPEAKDKGYPKCRAAGVASKMTDSQKKAACAQKRRAEKTNPKSGTGNAPKMVSYKPRKKQNESIEELVKLELKKLI
jgi:hypothetical protein